MIENNVFKAKKLLSFLIDYKPDHFFCVSTDKATNPVNIMGASKRLAEIYVQSFADMNNNSDLTLEKLQSQRENDFKNITGNNR